MSSTTASTAMSTPRFRSIGFMPAATALAPSRTIAWASTVAVVVPSPAWSLVFDGDLLDHLRAHVLEPVGELDLLGDGDAVLGDARRAVGLVEDDVAALGAERHLDRVGEDVDAAQHPLARVGVKFDFFGSHVDLPPYAAFFAADLLDFDDAHDVRFLHDHQLLAVELDLGARPLAEQHAVAGLDVQRVNAPCSGARPGRRRRPRPPSAFPAPCRG